MPADRVIIEELFLRLPGLSDQAARAISGEVALRIGHGLEDALPLHDLGALEIRLTARQGASRDELVDSVARAVITALTR
jgi:hypothetical protein